MYYEEEQPLPTLMPIRKKKNEIIANQNQGDRNAQFSDMLKIFTKDKGKQPEKEQIKIDKIQQKPIIGGEALQQFQKKFKSVHEHGGKKQDVEKKRNSDKQKEIQKQKSKYLMNEMMRKINAKNISQELYPVTNETIEMLIHKMDEQIQNLKNEAERKDFAYKNNTSNQHLKQQLQKLHSSIDRCMTVKQLYNQKINLRNKISILQKNIISLKEENQNLKIKINRGIETIQNHMHSLPCENQKAFKQALTICQSELKSERQMRISLQNNISEIVLNFTRLYQEADAARLIVTRKLKELQEREKNIAQPLNVEPERDGSVSEKKSPQLETFEERRLKKSVHEGSSKDVTDIPKTTKKPVIYNQYSPQQPIRGKPKQAEKITTSPFSLQEQIRKMRGNQINLSRSQYSK